MQIVIGVNLITLEAFLIAYVNIPIVGKTKIGEVRGNLHTGIWIDINPVIARGKIGLTLENNKEVWLHVDLTSPFGSVKKDVRLFSL